MQKRPTRSEVPLHLTWNLDDLRLTAGKGKGRCGSLPSWVTGPKAGWRKGRRCLRH